MKLRLFFFYQISEMNKLNVSWIFVYFTTTLYMRKCTRTFPFELPHAAEMKV